MGRLEWTELPDAVRRFVEAQVHGPVARVVNCVDGGGSDFSGILYVEASAVFVKAVRQDSWEMWLARRAEIRFYPALPLTAPRLLWHAESLDGWLVVGYEYLEGRVPRLQPGSPDVPYVIGILTELSQFRVPSLSRFESLGARWVRESPWRTLLGRSPRVLPRWERQRVNDFVERELHVFDVLAAGTGLAHTDIGISSVRFGRREIRVSGWTWACRAPAWVDSAVFAVRLVEAGHSPQEAETWLGHVPAWADANPSSLDAFSVALLGVWTLSSRYLELTAAAREYAAYRLRQA